MVGQYIKRSCQQKLQLPMGEMFNRGICVYKAVLAMRYKKKEKMP